MPAYFNKATGKRVTVDEATYDGKRLRDGYNWMLEEGETARFSIDMIDGAATSRRSVFLTDTKVELKETLIAADVAQQRTVHDQKFAFLGVKAPAFDEAKARLIAAGRVTATDGGVRDVAREYALTGVAAMPATGLTADAAPRANDTNAAMRNLARDHRY
jgi:hypothetical protein